MLVTIFAIALAIVCVWAYFRLPVREIPNIQIPYVIVETEYLSAAPEEVESLITKPLERKISELGDIDNINSLFVRGFSQIYVEFASGKDVDKKVREIQDKLSGIKDDLPESASFPGIKGYRLTDRPALIVLVSGSDDPYYLGKIADNLKDELKQVKGCSSYAYSSASFLLGIRGL
jgi:HAE1 family hydrophobic/amphiphilic exporter-1